ncbi:pentapeptide repeat-containing protein [Micromonospora sp. NPDC023956]|uniref:pentapeptide repeat-containing protein n=1 Tax=Micromonospora sp. NPDC023956 TaxID=3155722 RepID=UPI0034064691
MVISTPHLWRIHPDLTNTNLTLADLAGAYLPMANLYDADLTGADLESANLTGADLAGARTDDRTRMPAGVPRPAPCD